MGAWIGPGSAGHQDRRHGILGYQTVPEILDFASDDRLRFLRFFTPQLAIRVGDLLQVIDVVQIGAVDLRHIGIDVAWNREIDQEQCAHSPGGEGSLDLGRLDEVVRRGSRSDHDVAGREVRINAFEIDRLSVEA